MMIMPSIALVAWGSRDITKVFVKVPNEKGRYILTHRCVIEVPCPDCKSIKGEPCRNTKNGVYWANTHADRRRQATILYGHPRVRPDAVGPEDQIVPVDANEWSYDLFIT